MEHVWDEVPCFLNKPFHVSHCGDTAAAILCSNQDPVLDLVPVLEPDIGAVLVSTPGMVTADPGQKISPASPAVVSGLSLGVCNSDAIAVDIGLIKARKWLIEWLREGANYNEKHLAFLKDMEKNTCRANKVARPPDCAEELALMQKVLLDLKVGQA